MKNEILREVFETEQFAIEKLKIGPDIKKVDDILYKTAVFTLARDPYCGKQTFIPNIWAFIAYPSPLAGFTIFYSFTDTRVSLISIIREDETREDFYSE